MAFRCDYCAGLSIERLVDLAKKEFAGHTFPSKAFYQHHSSFRDLEQTAERGCAFCRLILDSFKGTPWDYGLTWPTAWGGVNLDSDFSAYHAAMALDASDVKLCINSEHFYDSEPLDKASVFDALMVQIGPVQDYEDEEAEDAFPTLVLALSRPSGMANKPLFMRISLTYLTASLCPDQVLTLGNIRVGRFQTHPDLASAANFDIARGWLNDCRTCHTVCLSNNVPELPTRVIDVGAADGSQKPRLVLSHGARADYAALSHCWGERIDVLLLAKILGSFQNALPYSDLPVNFRDAIRVISELGIRYVWIDSLCIIQDSSEDWEKESKKMGHIYRDATVTISASVSNRSSAGILNQTPEYHSRPAPVGLRAFQDGKRIEEVTVEWKPAQEESFRGVAEFSPFSSRSWTLQESVLSPRLLYYGKRQIYWRCLNGFRVADGTPGDNLFPDDAYTNLSPVLMHDVMAKPPDTSPDTEVILRDWYDLVNAYTRRNLSFPTDKFPAISGIAQHLHQAVGGDYLAGLWSNDFLRGLLWLPDGGSFTKHVSTYRAPSWSWAVTKAPLIFLTDELPSSPSQLELLEYGVTPSDPTNPFGQIRSAHLTVKGLTKPLVRSTQVVNSNRLPNIIGTVYYDNPEGDDEAGSTPIGSLFFVEEEDSPGFILSIITHYGDDEGWEVDRNSFHEDLLVLLVHTDDGMGDKWSHSDGKCLALRRSADKQEETYERVGYLNVSEPSLKWLATWDRRTLKLV